MTIEKKMNFVLVPFKTFKNAKTRLRKDLSDLDTEYIVKIMLEDVLEQVSKSKIAEKKFILTADEKAIKIAKENFKDLPSEATLHRYWTRFPEKQKIVFQLESD